MQNKTAVSGKEVRENDKNRHITIKALKGLKILKLRSSDARSYLELKL